MLSYLITKYKNSRNLIHYFILTYVDKIISFATPLFLLFVIKDKDLYSFVEVTFSYATLTMIVAELGVSSYLFYGYKHADDKERFLLDSQISFRFLLLMYVLLAIPLLIGINYYDKNLLSLISVVVIRSLFMLYFSFYSNIYRLKDKPSRIYLASLVVNLSSLLLVIVANWLSFTDKIFYFFLPSFLLLIGVCARFILLEAMLFTWSTFLEFIKKALLFSWPIIINVLAMNYMNNYAKIYAYGNLSKEEMIQISLIMRIGLIVQLTHAAFSAYFSKTLFMDANPKLNLKVFKQYNLVILVSTFLVFFVLVSTNYFFREQIHVSFSLSTFLFILYIILWCYIAYFELYFGVVNANKQILIYSIVSALVYTILLKVSGHISILTLSIYMIISVLLNLMLVLIGLYRLKILTFGSFNRKTKSQYE